MTIEEAIERAKFQAKLNFSLSTKTEEQNMLETLVNYVIQTEAAKEKIRKTINELSGFDYREDFINGCIDTAEFFLKELEVEDDNEA